MVLFVLISFFLGTLVTWLILKRKFTKLLEEGIKESVQAVGEQLNDQEKKLKEAEQQVADLSYQLKEREKDIKALQGRAE
jgi:cell division protein FtsL